MASVRQVERLLRRKNVRGLCRLLHHRDVQVRRCAAQALGELADPAGIACLERVLRVGSDQYVIRHAIDSLRAIGSPTAIDALTATAFRSGQQIPRLAAHALAEMSDPQAVAALRLKDILFRNDWEALAAVGEDARRPLSIILQSEQYAAWPSGKRKQVLAIATRLDVRSIRHSREMLNMGLFVSGIHTIGDLLRGLRHRSPDVRIAAAEKLALTGQDWLTGPLYRRFRREARSGGERSAAIAVARALARLGDDRAIAYYRHRLYHADGAQAAEAARTLAEIGTPQAAETLFWFVASPPPPPAYRNVPMTLAALESIGPPAVDALCPVTTHEDPKARRLMIEVILRCGHPDAASLLGQLARDDDPEVQHAAIDALADLNTPAAAETLLEMADDIPRRWVTRALAAITHPDGPEYLRTLVPDITSLHGMLLGDDRQPLPGAYVQVVKEHFLGEQTGWGWQAVSARAKTDAAGAFALVLLTTDRDAALRLKVTVPPRRGDEDSAALTADIVPFFGEANHVRAQLDRFFNRLVVTVRAGG